MDTNALMIIDRLIEARLTPAASSNTMLIWGMAINAVLTMLTMVLAFLGRADKVETKDAIAETKDSVKKIEEHTNGERSATTKLVEDMRSEMLRISKENSTLKEQQRGQDVAKEIAAGVAQAKIE